MTGWTGEALRFLGKSAQKALKGWRLEWKEGFGLAWKMRIMRNMINKPALEARARGGAWLQGQCGLGEHVIKTRIWVVLSR